VSQYTFNGSSTRIAKARSARLIPKAIRLLMGVFAGFGLLGGAALVVLGLHPGFSLIGVAIMLLVALTWIHRDLDILPAAAIGTTKALDALLPINLADRYHEPITALELWQLLASTWEGRFMQARFELDANLVAQSLAAGIDLDQVWAETEAISAKIELTTYQAGAIIAAIFSVGASLTKILTRAKVTPTDLAELRNDLRTHLRGARPVR